MIKFLSILGLVAFVAAKSYEDYGSSEVKLVKLYISSIYYSI